MLILVASAALLMAPAASAPDPKAAPTPEAKAENPQKPKLVCTSERPMGSNIPKRVCRTPEQVQAEMDAARRQGVINSDAQCRGAAC